MLSTFLGQNVYLINCCAVEFVLDTSQNWLNNRDGVGAKEGGEGLVIDGGGPSDQEGVPSLPEFAGSVNAMQSRTNNFINLIS